MIDNKEAAPDSIPESKPFSWRKSWTAMDFIKKIIIQCILKPTGLARIGLKNSLDLRVTEREIRLEKLPVSFNGMRIIYMSDFHLGKCNDLPQVIAAKLKQINADLCLLGGDYRFHFNDPIDPTLEHLKIIIPHIQTPLGIYGVLGNHDCREMAPKLESMGIKMLLNDSASIEKKNQRIHIAGVEDPHNHKTHDIKKALKGIPSEDFVIFLAHSPDLYEEAEEQNVKLYFCGHTHHGQIRFPILGAPIINSVVPRKYTQGFWSFKNLKGFTSPGVGSSLIQVRYNCPPELTVFTLRSGERTEY